MYDFLRCEKQYLRYKIYSFGSQSLTYLLILTFFKQNCNVRSRGEQGISLRDEGESCPSRGVLESARDREFAGKCDVSSARLVFAFAAEISHESHNGGGSGNARWVVAAVVVIRLTCLFLQPTMLAPHGSARSRCHYSLNFLTRR